jgi:uncharacterized membrane protein required for colicin V production
MKYFRYSIIITIQWTISVVYLLATIYRGFVHQSGHLLGTIYRGFVHQSGHLLATIYRGFFHQSCHLLATIYRGFVHQYSGQIKCYAICIC